MALAPLGEPLSTLLSIDEDDVDALTERRFLTELLRIALSKSDRPSSLPIRLPTPRLDGVDVPEEAGGGGGPGGGFAAIVCLLDFVSSCVVRDGASAMVAASAETAS